MANIQVLDQNTINQIAAGEVIERPASVVKELLENAIDAKATAVTVEIKDGGLSLIRVTDNGCGIPREEIPLAFLRHATSKIRTVEDLFTIASLGFRGEALSSIASVAQVELITKTGDSMSGFRYRIEGGEEVGLEEIGTPDGTTFIARNLFYNTPARRKFLKTPMTEAAHVADLVEKIALSHPEISIRLIQNNQSKLHTSGNHNMKDIIYTVFGRDIAANLLPVEMGKEPVRVDGYIGKPLVARGNRNFEHYYINGRYIKSSIINKAIEDAYKPYMMQHKYPFTMLHFTIDPTFLDVNVHPAKMELRFKDGELIYKMVYHTISMALSRRELIPEVELNNGKESGEKKNFTALSEDPERHAQLKPVSVREHPEPFEKKRKESTEVPVIREESAPYCEKPKLNDMDRPQLNDSENRRQGTEAESVYHAVNTEILVNTENSQKTEKTELIQKAEKQAEKQAEKPGEKPGEKPKQLDLFEEKLLSKPARSEHKLLGQLFDTYWLVQFRDHLYIIDQHAAHEKVLYEKTMASLKSREYTSQIIHPPIVLTLNHNEALLLKKYEEQFTSIGFEIEPFGGKEFAVRAVPANLFSIAKRELLLEMIDSLTEDTEQGDPELIREKIASMSCKAAVKGNHKLTVLEADRLIDELLELENPYACPHGRPTIISMSKYELEKKFKRIL